jgi:hypothetical protein
MTMLMRTFIATALLCTAAVSTAAAQDWEQDGRWRRRDGLQVRIGRSYHLPADQIVSWPVVVIGGSATIDGRLNDDLVVIGGQVRIGPQAQIRGEIVCLGGEVQAADSADVSGEIHDISVIWPEVRFALEELLWRMNDGWWAALSLAGTVFRFTLTMFAACLLALVAPGWIRRIEDSVNEAPLASGFVGLASEIFMVPVFLVVVAGLVLTIVGIPLLLLLPFAGLALVLAWVAGFAAVAAQLGRRLRGRSGSEATGPMVLDVASGVALLFVLTFIGDVLAFWPSALWPFSNGFSLAGFLVEYLAWTLGLGAALLAPLRRRWPVAPPRIPSAASASA